SDPLPGELSRQRREVYGDAEGVEPAQERGAAIVPAGSRRSYVEASREGVARRREPDGLGIEPEISSRRIVRHQMKMPPELVALRGERLPERLASDVPRVEVPRAEPDPFLCTH